MRARVSLFVLERVIVGAGVGEGNNPLGVALPHLHCLKLAWVFLGTCPSRVWMIGARHL